MVVHRIGSVVTGLSGHVIHLPRARKPVRVRVIWRMGLTWTKPEDECITEIENSARSGCSNCDNGQHSEVKSSKPS